MDYLAIFFLADEHCSSLVEDFTPCSLVYPPGFCYIKLAVVDLPEVTSLQRM